MIVAQSLSLLGIALIAVAFFYRLWIEWIDHGLTHTHYLPLALIAVGAALAGGAAFYAYVWWLAIAYALIFFASGGAALTLIAWKIHARVTVLAHRPHGHGEI